MIRYRPVLKRWYFAARLHRFTPAGVFEFLAGLAMLSRWIDVHKREGYSDFCTGKFDYNKRYNLYRHVIAEEKLNDEIDYLEFGVAKGHSFRWWAANITHPKARFFGFDTFTGLPEDWGHFKKGDMSGNNEPPLMDDVRCRFYQGLFQQTLPSFIRSYIPGKRRVIMMDADLFSSTLYALTALHPLLTRGDIIIFDEFNVPLHEFKAFRHWLSAYYITYQVLGSVNNFHQVAIKIL